MGAAGRRATVELGGGARYEGRTGPSGAREGRGTLVLPGGAGWVTGEWRADELHGSAEVLLADGSSVRGRYTAGSLGGGVLEHAPGGALRYAGEYVDGAREGRGVARLDDGGVFDAAWRGGLLHGRGLYFYPGGPAAGPVLVGEWREGDVVALYCLDGGAGEPRWPPGGLEGAAADATEPCSSGPRADPRAAARLRAAERCVLAGLPLEAALGPLPRRPPRARSLLSSCTEDALQERAVSFRTYGGCLRGGGQGRPAASSASPPVSGSGRARFGTYARRDLGEGELIGFLPCLGPEGALSRSSAPNAAFEPVSHPLHGDTLGLRAMRDIAEGEEVCSALLFADPERWEEGLSHRSEEGFYCHMRGAPSKVLVRASGAADCNGTVQVKQYGPWRALVFNNVEQGMTYNPREGEEGYEPWPPAPPSGGQRRPSAAAVCKGDAGEEEPPGGLPLPGVVGFEYQLVLACAALGALGGCWPVPACLPPWVLNVGLGAGAVPAFLRYQCKNAQVLNVEVDEEVLRCVNDGHGFRVRRFDGSLSAALTDCLKDLKGARTRPLSRRASPGRKGPPTDPRLLHCVLGDAEAVLGRLGGMVAAGKATPFGCVVLDAYDGAGCVPTHLQSPAFVASCAAVLQPEGWVVANLFNGPGADAATGRFRTTLERLVGPVVALPVRTQETNVVLAARKPGRPTVLGQDRPPPPARQLADRLANVYDDAARRAAAAAARPGAERWRHGQPNYLRCLRACRDSAAAAAERAPAAARG